MGSFLKSVASFGKGFLTGGVGGGIASALGARAEDKAKEKIQGENRALNAIELEQLDIARRNAVEGILEDQNALEESLAQRGLTDSTAAREARLKLKREAEQRMQAVESASRRHEAGERIGEAKEDLEKSTRRAGYLGEGINQGLALASMVAGGVGGATPAPGGPGAFAGSQALWSVGYGQAAGALAGGKTPITGKRLQSGGIGGSGLSQDVSRWLGY